MIRFTALALFLFACTGSMTGDPTDSGDDSPALDGATPTPGADGGSPARDAGGPATDASVPAPAPCDPACGEGEVCVDGACDATITGVAGIDGVLLGDPSRYDNEVLISQDPDMSWRQRAGAWVWDGSGGSVEGCCWWGRGVIQTTGRCNFGVLNHFLGRTHLNPAEHTPPATVLYPDIDFCQEPESICASTDHPELKWVAGVFYWMSTVQTYDEDGWAYLDQLRAFVAGGLSGNAFIDAVSGIVNRGCHDAPCATGPVDGVDDRRANFDSVLRVMALR